MPTLHDRLTHLFMSHLLETPLGRAHLLNQIADAEDNGEASVFDQVMAWVDDPALAKAIDRHRTDELGHAELLRARRDAQGVSVGPVPESLQVMRKFDQRLDGFFSRPIRDARGVVTAYLVLQVIEERAVTQFGFMEAAFRPVDPLTADAFRSIAADEVRHLKYCHAIVKRYSTDEAATKAELRSLRALETEVFAETSAANLDFCLDLGLMGGWHRQALWRGIRAVGRRMEVRPGTGFEKAEASAALGARIAVASV